MAMLNNQRVTIIISTMDAPDPPCVRHRQATWVPSSLPSGSPGARSIFRPSDTPGRSRGCNGRADKAWAGDGERLPKMARPQKGGVGGLPRFLGRSHPVVILIMNVYESSCCHIENVMINQWSWTHSQTKRLEV